MKNEAWRRDPSFYDRLYPLATRYTDVDPWRHLNNVAVYALHQEARIQWLAQALGENAWYSDGVLLRPATVSTDFVGEGRYPGLVEVGARCVGHDEHGWDLATAVFQSGACFGVQQTRMAAWCDGRPVALPQALQDAAAGYLSLENMPAMDPSVPSPADVPVVPLEAYPSVMDITGRFGDADADACIGEAIVARYMEQARASATGTALRAASEEVRSGKLGTVVAHGNIRFLSHRRTAALLKAGVGVVRVGNSSYVIRAGLFCADECIAVGDTVLVLTDRGTTRPAALPLAAREALMDMSIAGVTA